MLPDMLMLTLFVLIIFVFVTHLFLIIIIALFRKQICSSNLDRAIHALVFEASHKAMFRAPVYAFVHVFDNILIISLDGHIDCLA